jgi:hypothetical protein
MNFRISDHAEEELVRRRIPRRLLEETLAAPQQIVPAYGGRKAYQSQIDFGSGRIYLLRAIVSEEGDFATVVTVYRTSRIRKYWRAP